MFSDRFVVARGKRRCSHLTHADTLARTRRFEEKFSRLSVAEQAMAAAAAGKGVLKFSPNKPRSRGPPPSASSSGNSGTGAGGGGARQQRVRGMDAGSDVSGDGGSGGGRVVAAARNAAEQLEAAAAVAERAAVAAGQGANGSPETGAATAELESSIRDLQGIVANLAQEKDPAAAAGSPSPPLEAPTRRGGAVPMRGAQAEQYTRERQERQDRLQKLYAELNKTEK